MNPQDPRLADNSDCLAQSYEHTNRCSLLGTRRPRTNYYVVHSREMPPHRDVDRQAAEMPGEAVRLAARFTPLEGYNTTVVASRGVLA